MQLEQKKLQDKLNIPGLKAELAEVRASGDIVALGDKEREIANKIQKAVSAFPYQESTDQPSEIVKKQYMNCVGASLLGGGLLTEVGINYLVGDLPGHSILFIVTSDNQLIWQDMVSNPQFNGSRIYDSDLQQTKAKEIGVRDIIEFQRNPKTPGLQFEMSPDSTKYKINMLDWWLRNPSMRHRRDITVFPPDRGMEFQVLINTAISLKKMKDYEMAVEAFQRASLFTKEDYYLYASLGDSLKQLGRDEEAKEAYLQASKLKKQNIPQE